MDEPINEGDLSPEVHPGQTCEEFLATNPPVATAWDCLRAIGLVEHDAWEAQPQWHAADLRRDDDNL